MAEEDISATREDKFTGAGLIYKLDKANSVVLVGKGKRTNTGGSDRGVVYTFGAERNLGKGVSVSASVFNSETRTRAELTSMTAVSRLDQS